MERLVVLLFVLFLGVQSISTKYTQDEGELGFQSTKTPVNWFDKAESNRRKRNQGSEYYKSPAMERQQLESLIDLIQQSPWAALAVSGNEGKRYDVNFVPRLGRESGEEMGNGRSPNMESELVSETISQRSPPFAPRLGKRVLPFAPRLGRENFHLDRA